MPADSLLEMAQRACARCSARITDIGELSYDLVRPILLKITSPERLQQLEQNCPQLVGKDGELWLAFIKRDIPGWESKRHEPRDPKNWWKVYRKLKQEAMMDIEAGEDKLRAALNSIQSEKAQNVAQLVTRRDLPRPAALIRRPRPAYNPGRFGGGTSKMTVIDRIRRGTGSSTKNRMSRPMHELQQRATVISQAPQSMVDELKKKAATAQTLQRVSPTVNRVGNPMAIHAGPGRSGDGSYDILQDREARLRAMKGGNPSRNGSRGSDPIQRNGQHEDTLGSNQGLLASVLEDFDDDDEEEADNQRRHSLKPPRQDNPRTHSPVRISTQQMMAQKRKPAPSLFMATKKVKK